MNLGHQLQTRWYDKFHASLVSTRQQVRHDIRESWNVFRHDRLANSDV